MLQLFHTGMCAQVVIDGSQFSSFPADVAVIQVCGLDPIILSLFLVTTTLVSDRDVEPSLSVGIDIPLDGGLFNLRHLQDKS